VIGEYERAFYGGQYAVMAPLFEHYGVQLWTPEADGRIDFGAEDHEQAMLMLGVQSKREIARTRIRVRTAMAAQTKEQGRYLGGRPPYGYRLADAGPHPNKAHAAWGRRAHRLEPDSPAAPAHRGPGDGRVPAGPAAGRLKARHGWPSARACPAWGPLLLARAPGLSCPAGRAAGITCRSGRSQPGGPQGREVTARAGGRRAEAAVTARAVPAEASAAGTRPRPPAGTRRDTESATSGQTSCGLKHADSARVTFLPSR
jgi:hypothetical protein